MNLASLYQLLFGCERKFQRFHNSSAADFHGTIRVSGGSIHYWKFGCSHQNPLIVIHGGPGFPHNYLLPLKLLSDERQVIFYDQLGCGASDQPHDAANWRIERFVDELRTICRALKISKFHLLGHSWGTITALECSFCDPGTASLILASPCLSIPRWTADAARLRATLPAQIRHALDAAENSGDFAAPEAKAAAAEYYRRFVYGVHSHDELISEASAGFGTECYHAMWGPNEFLPTGTLRDYDRAENLKDVRVPVLYTCGRSDEATPEATEWYRSLTPNARLRVFELSAHMPHLSEAAEYVREVRNFLREADKA